MVSSWCAMLERRLAMPVDPVAERDDDGTADEAGPGDGRSARRQRAKGRADVREDKQHDERPERIAAGAIARPASREIEAKTRGEDRDLDHERAQHRIPQPEADLDIASRRERQIGAMHDQIEE